MELQHTHKETFEDGLAIRKEVLGAAHVERSLANASDFATPMQELVTEAWAMVVPKRVAAEYFARSRSS